MRCQNRAFFRSLFSRANMPFIFVIPRERTGSPRSAAFALRGVFFSPRGICFLLARHPERGRAEERASESKDLLLFLILTGN